MQEAQGCSLKRRQLVNEDAQGLCAVGRAAVLGSDQPVNQLRNRLAGGIAGNERPPAKFPGDVQHAAKPVLLARGNLQGGQVKEHVKRIPD